MDTEQIASYLNAYLNGGIFGVSFVQLTIWVVIGVVAGSLLPKPRPFGLIGSMLGGVLGGLLAGWAVANFPALNLMNYIDGIPRNIRDEFGAGLSGFIGAIVVLVLLRMVVPKNLRN